MTSSTTAVLLRHGLSLRRKPVVIVRAKLGEPTFNRACVELLSLASALETRRPSARHPLVWSLSRFHADLHPGG